MNQDQVKAALLRLNSEVEDFAVLFTGKRSNKVDGLYYPERREILIHNTNLQSDNEIIYTAIHEFAHHIQFTTSAQPVSSRSHTTHFWSIFHKLLFDAEEKGIYKNIFKTDPEFITLTGRLKRDYLADAGEKMKEFGSLLIEAMRLCEMRRASFEDYVDRELGLHRFAAKNIIRSYTYDINPQLGPENMKTVARIADKEKRKEVEDAFLARMSPDMVKAEFSTRLNEIKDMTKLQYLKNEKERLMEAGERLNQKLIKIMEQIKALEQEMNLAKAEDVGGEEITPAPDDEAAPNAMRDDYPEPELV